MKLGGKCKIVHKIISKIIYDIPPVEYEVSVGDEGPSNCDAYQENEFIELFVDFSTFNMIPLSRHDDDPDVHDTDLIESQCHPISPLVNDEDSFTDDGDHSKESNSMDDDIANDDIELD